MTATDSNRATANLRLFQCMAGARHGGAELFFERLATAFQQKRVTQHLAIKPEPHREARLSSAGIALSKCGFSPLLAPLHRRQLKQAVRQMEANVILSWMNRASSMMPDCGVPHVARLGGFYNLKYYAGCDWLVGNTRDVADYLIAEGWPADRVHYQVNFVPDGLSGPVFDGPQSGGPVIAALGRLHVNKAFDTLLRAFAKFDDGTLWLAGEGPEGESLAALAIELGISERVHFLGWQDDSQAVIRGADMLVCPSRHEPFGNVIAEAMACGKPVIATRSNGALELLEEGVSGLLAAVDDHAALADLMKTLGADRGLQSKLGIAARAFWQAHLSPDRVSDDWISFLDQVAHQGRAG